MTYITKVLIGFDQFCNTLMNGYPDETLSARAWRDSVKGKRLACNIINKIFFWQENHCYRAYVSELERTQYPKDYR